MTSAITITIVMTIAMTFYTGSAFALEESALFVQQSPSDQIHYAIANQRGLGVTDIYFVPNCPKATNKSSIKADATVEVRVSKTGEATSIQSNCQVSSIQVNFLVPVNSTNDSVYQYSPDLGTWNQVRQILIAISDNKEFYQIAVMPGSLGEFKLGKKDKFNDLKQLLANKNTIPKLISKKDNDTYLKITTAFEGFSAYINSAPEKDRDTYNKIGKLFEEFETRLRLLWNKL